MSIDPEVMKAAIETVKDFDLPYGYHQIHTVGIGATGQMYVKTYIFETGDQPLISNDGDWQWDYRGRPVNSRNEPCYIYVDDDGVAGNNAIERAWDGD